MFTPTTIELGTIEAGKEVLVSFNYTKEVVQIIKLESPCDCALPQDLSVNRIIRVKYTPKPVPPHLRGQGYYEVVKTITITYKTYDVIEDQTATVTFTAKIV